MTTDSDHISIGIVDNDVLALQLLTAGLSQRFGDGSILWTARDGHTAIAKCLRERSVPDVLVLDLSLEDMSGVEVCHRIRSVSPRPSIVGLTSFSPAYYRHGLEQAGAQALVVKGRTDTLAEAIQATCHGDAYPPEGGFRNACDAYDRLRATDFEQSTEPLTIREREVMNLVMFGMTNAEIAKELGLGVPTVKTHLQHIMKKLGVSNRTSAISVWQALHSMEVA